MTHAKEPFNFGELEDHTHKIEAYNPLCGDKFLVFLNIDDGVIKEVSFTGFGCNISKATTSILAKKIIGLGLSKTFNLIEKFLKVIDENEEQAPEELTDDEELLALSAARQFPERYQCASLSWTALLSELNADQ